MIYDARSLKLLNVEAMSKNRVPPIKYVTLFPGRTGSTYLASHMQAHPQILSKFEILGRRSTNWDRQFEMLQELFETRRNPEIKAIGFKTKIHAVLNRDIFTQYLSENQFRIIHLIRRNKLKFIISVVRAKMLRNREGVSNVFDQNQEPIGPMEIPVEKFTRATKRLNVAIRLQAYIDTLDLPKLKIAYEDLLNDEQHTLNRVWDFLEVDHVSTQGVTRKNTPDNVRQAVTNLDQLLDKHPEMVPFVDQD